MSKYSKTVVFIHGLFMNTKSWNHWVTYFEARGYTCHAPAYPFHQGSPSDLRNNPPEGLKNLTFSQVISHLTQYIDGLPEKPLLVGHSMGGLAVQKLMELGKGTAGVCIDTAPPRGVFSFQWSFLKANLSTINPLKGNSPCLPSVKWFQYAFCNTMTLEQTSQAYEEFLVPEGRNIPRSSTGPEGRIDFKKPHAPLYFIGGVEDHIIPLGLVMKNVKAYKSPGSLKKFESFPGRTHWICSQSGWEEIAGSVDAWFNSL